MSKTHYLKKKKIDSTTNLGHHEQMSIVIRYFDDGSFASHECFIGIQKLFQVHRVYRCSVNTRLTKLRITFSGL